MVGNVAELLEVSLRIVLRIEFFGFGIWLLLLPSV
jgi:hypothetical protein